MPSDATVYSGSTVYIVDDDEAIRDSLAALLATHGMRTETFASAEAFLAHYRPGGTGCLLLDVRMPGMTGLALQEVLAAQRVVLPVIIITGHGDIPMAVKAMTLGASDFIEKPYTDAAIVNAIERALAATAKPGPGGRRAGRAGRGAGGQACGASRPARGR